MFEHAFEEVEEALHIVENDDADEAPDHGNHVNEMPGELPGEEASELAESSYDNPYERL